MTDESFEDFALRIERRANELIAQAEAFGARQPRARGRPGNVLTNTVLEEFRHVVFEQDNKWPAWIDDVLHGVCNLDWYRTSYTEDVGVSGTPEKIRAGLPLSKLSLRKVFTFLETINNFTVGALLKVDERQARRYVQAAKLALPLLERGKPRREKDELVSERSEEDQGQMDQGLRDSSSD